jgi:hypothetical protein
MPAFLHYFLGRSTILNEQVEVGPDVHWCAALQME